METKDELPRARRSPSKASVLRALLGQDMPLGEIVALLAADDPATVRRYLELHRERLNEHVAEQLRMLDVVERALAGSLDRGERQIA
jgi:hypothetical protein